jgi:hypothetical protein
MRFAGSESKLELEEADEGSKTRRQPRRQKSSRGSAHSRLALTNLLVKPFWATSSEPSRRMLRLASCVCGCVREVYDVRVEGKDDGKGTSAEGVSADARPDRRLQRFGSSGNCNPDETRRGSVAPPPRCLSVCLGWAGLEALKE